ncbi:MAG: hypothetical protein UT05_C0006G0020 [Parcubacteria group bacterium GW2011_GWF2_38_76]|nr:MAG: hypothetical protein UT05_C0006G0020 [Parcubacteria group bacterium GW2011_GWF2_38_76]HBM45880.1 hypothetical protein [Patescibacteria group bacterium]
MTKLEIKLKNKIMRRVYAVWFLKKIFSLALLRALITLVLFMEFAREVSISSVINNLPKATDFSANYHYISFAFTHTEASVQIYLLGIMAMVSWIVLQKLVKLVPNIGIRGSTL